jgi:hypothetical protein
MKFRIGIYVLFISSECKASRRPAASIRTPLSVFTKTAIGLIGYHAPNGGITKDVGALNAPPS